VKVRERAMADDNLRDTEWALKVGHQIFQVIKDNKLTPDESLFFCTTISSTILDVNKVTDEHMELFFQQIRDQRLTLKGNSWEQTMSKEIKAIKKKFDEKVMSELANVFISHETDGEECLWYLAVFVASTLKARSPHEGGMEYFMELVKASTEVIDWKQ
jgi:hypothetical protein